MLHIEGTDEFVSFLFCSKSGAYDATLKIWFTLSPLHDPQNFMKANSVLQSSCISPPVGDFFLAKSPVKQNSFPISSQFNRSPHLFPESRAFINLSPHISPTTRAEICCKVPIKSPYSPTSARGPQADDKRIRQTFCCSFYLFTFFIVNQCDL